MGQASSILTAGCDRLLGCLPTKRGNTWHDRRVVVVEIFLIALVVFGVAAVAMGFGGSMTRFAPDWPGRSLPESRAVVPADVEAARFSLAFRGYRMSEVDLTMDRLATEIAERDSVIQQLTGAAYQRPVPVDDAEPAATVEPVVPADLSEAVTATMDLPDTASWAADDAGEGPV
jgi:DivIVA domain-containing protein